MKTVTYKGTRLREPSKYGRYILLNLIPLSFLVLFALFRSQEAVMEWLVRWIANPYKAAISVLNDHLPFSAAEVIYAALVIGAPLWVLRTVFLIIRRPHRLRRMVRRLAGLTAACLTAGCLFTLLWGINYCVPSIPEQVGLTDRGATAEELYQLTLSFAAAANDCADRVERDSEGHFDVAPSAILSSSSGLYDDLSQEFPPLSGSDHTPKAIYFSRIMSYLDFTGFYFPFTAEANLNTDMPAALLPVTLAHELSHQRGVADEAEANFFGILACLHSDNPVFRYSGCLLGYIHLSNALYQAAPSKWEQVASTLSSSVRQDLSDNNAYWKEIRESKLGEKSQAVSNSVYRSVISEYGEEDVLRRYGACVDLLVAYYYDWR